jgi:hypothetical protein
MVGVYHFLRTKTVLDRPPGLTCGLILSARIDKIPVMKKNSSAKLTALGSTRNSATAPFRRRPFRIQVVSVIEDHEISLYDKVVHLPLEVDQCEGEKDDAA